MKNNLYSNKFEKITKKMKTTIKSSFSNLKNNNYKLNKSLYNLDNLDLSKSNSSCRNNQNLNVQKKQMNYKINNKQYKSLSVNKPINSINNENEEEFNIIQNLWDDLGISEDYQEEFIKYIFSLDEKKEKNLIFSYEKENLIKFRESLIKLSIDITKRDNHILTLKKLISYLEKIVIQKTEKMDNNVYDKIKDVLIYLRINAINIINQMGKIREISSYYELKGKWEPERVNPSYLYNSNYLSYMVRNNKFINNTILFNFIETDNGINKTDLFFSNIKYIITSNNTKIEIPKSKDLQKLIAKCNYILLQDHLLNKIHNNIILKKRNILSPKLNQKKNILSKSQSEIYLANDIDSKKYLTIFGHNKINLSRTLYYLKKTLGNKYEKMFINDTCKKNRTLNLKKNLQIMEKYFPLNKHIINNENIKKNNNKIIIEGSKLKMQDNSNEYKKSDMIIEDFDSDKEEKKNDRIIEKSQSQNNYNILINNSKYKNLNDKKEMKSYQKLNNEIDEQIKYTEKSEGKIQKKKLSKNNSFKNNSNNKSFNNNSINNKSIKNSSRNDSFINNNSFKNNSKKINNINDNNIINKNDNDKIIKSYNNRLNDIKETNRNLKSNNNLIKERNNNEINNMRIQNNSEREHNLKNNKYNDFINEININKNNNFINNSINDDIIVNYNDNNKISNNNSEIELKNDEENNIKRNENEIINNNEINDNERENKIEIDKSISNIEILVVKEEINEKEKDGFTEAKKDIKFIESNEEEKKNNKKEKNKIEYKESILVYNKTSNKKNKSLKMKNKKNKDNEKYQNNYIKEDNDDSSIKCNINNSKIEEKISISDNNYLKKNQNVSFKEDKNESKDKKEKLLKFRKYTEEELKKKDDENDDSEESIKYGNL